MKSFPIMTGKKNGIELVNLYTYKRQDRMYTRTQTFYRRHVN